MTISKAVKLLYRTDFPAFVSFAFREVRPGTPLLDNWHIDAMIRCLMDCLRGTVSRGIISAPPRSLKSFVASIAYPVFALSHNPTLKIMIVAGNRKLMKELEQYVRTLMRAPRFLAVFPHMKFDNRQPHIHLTAGGQLTFGVFGKSVIGRGADIIIVDDAYSPSIADNDGGRTEANEWFFAELMTRLNARSGLVLVVMQRLHRDDLVGCLLKRKELWRYMSIAAVATKDEKWMMPDGSIWERKKGELMQPSVLSRDDLVEILEEIGAVNFTRQYQQYVWLQSETRSGFFVSEHYDDDFYANWKPGDSLPNFFGGSVPETWYVRYELLGVGDRPPDRHVHRLTREQSEAGFIIQQQRLIASVFDDGTDGR